MDFLDRPKELRQKLILYTGYFLIAVAIVLLTLILVYRAYGFDFGKHGNVIQDGLLFFSSEPSSADIYINNKLEPSQTNSRLFIPSGIYNVKLTKTGYRDWSRKIVVNGGAVEHFDYPFLVPNSLTSKSVTSYSSAPGLYTQSPNQGYILVNDTSDLSTFDLYKINNPAKPIKTTFTLPAGLLTKANSSESWKLVSWADDNQHVLLEHIYDGKIEYILVDINDPTQSVNLNTTFATSPDDLTLANVKYNNYYWIDPTNQDLMTAGLSNTTPVIAESHVLAYKTYGNNTVLYATEDGAPTGQVLVKLDNGSGQQYDIRKLPVSTTYLLNLTTYSGVPYVAAGSDTDDRVYLYQNPISQLNNLPKQSPVPIWVFHLTDPDYVMFSSNAQFVMAESGDSYGVYDIENKLSYQYINTKYSLDTPQTNATWMDGDRLIYISGGKAVIQDYDDTNIQPLVSASSNYIPYFSSNYKYMFSVDYSAKNSSYSLDETQLVTKADL
jgi:hypothetical protein